MTHTFHIPVLGLAFSVDTPLKVAQYGISSVMSIVDDELVERLRAYYSKQHNLPYKEIEKYSPDARANRISAYLNMVKDLVDKQIRHIKRANWLKDDHAIQYFRLLPEGGLKQLFNTWLTLTPSPEKESLTEIIKEQITAGDIDVNIMSKVDKINHAKNGEMLPEQFSDASAALRGFANSNLRSSVVLSAGMNPRLYSYLAEFPAFMPNSAGTFDKKITLKVSDYRSALIQAKFLAKKGIWISEYRIESGLNCGGHAFATEGFLLGPILEEFKTNKLNMIQEVLPLYQQALAEKGIIFNDTPLLKITVQGGVGTNREHQFLMNHYGVDQVGWGSPFLLVPEATTVDEETLQNLASADASDFYISEASPLGVPFNNFRKSTAEINRLQRIEQGKPGFPCTKKYLVSSNVCGEELICTASRQYQNLKIKELKAQDLPQPEYQQAFDKIVEKQCLCEGLAAPAYLKYDILKPRERKAVAICPGPNTAYFKKVYSLKEMVDHIYGRINVLKNVERPSLFVNELELYVKHLATYINNNVADLDNKKKKYINKFNAQLLEGIAYYRGLQEQVQQAFGESKANFLEQLNRYELQLKPLVVE
ncbi:MULTISPECIES: hypothetical protein [Sphingobacterium]|uniref:Uncharacterized protein n=1 Tax=Sphingobacterium hotanense TaxID=649196 RepID=A0ABT7NSG3_9SPHI|nr:MULTISPECIES: hypothetical protein [Sphingobacterium]MDM1049883.1 hypothetical protein [Sphingobacterium hotanense]